MKGWSTPQLPQRQDSLVDQLRDVKAMAGKMGCYDAADWIGGWLFPTPPKTPPLEPPTREELLGDG